MAKHRFTHLTDGSSYEKSALARRHVTRQEFSKRIYRLMLAKNMTQSDLAREAGIARDSVSNYVRGNNMPEPVNLKKLADALGVEPNELLPNFDEQAIDMADDSPLEVKVLPSDPRYAQVRISQLVNVAILPKLFELLEKGGDYAEPADAEAK